METSYCFDRTQMESNAELTFLVQIGARDYSINSEILFVNTQFLKTVHVLHFIVLRFSKKCQGTFLNICWDKFSSNSFYFTNNTNRINILKPFSLHDILFSLSVNTKKIYGVLIMFKLEIQRNIS